MAKKSKAFSELLRLQKRKPQRPQNPLASLEKKLKKESFPFEKFVVSPPGYAKMSEVLEDFIEPYREEAQTKEATRRLLTKRDNRLECRVVPQTRAARDD